MNPTVYGNLTVAGELTVGDAARDAHQRHAHGRELRGVRFGTRRTCRIPARPARRSSRNSRWDFLSAGQAPSATNAIDVSVIYLPNIQFSQLTVDVSTTDASTSDFYSWAITDLPAT